MILDLDVALKMTTERHGILIDNLKVFMKCFWILTFLRMV